MRSRILNLFAVALVVGFLFGGSAFAQSSWLDMQPLPNWNSRSRAVLRTERMAQADLAQCRRFVRQPTLPQDFLLTGRGWTLVGPAQVFGRTTVVTVAGSFDGMCRPLEFQTLVFVGNRVAGTMSPAPMQSRTDGSLVNVRMLSETDLTAEYVRYRESDALCCPWKRETVSFSVKPDGANFLLVPTAKSDAGGGVENQQAGAATLANTVWRWESLDASAGLIKVDRPENYQLEFTAGRRVNVVADCNRGRGTYQTDGSSLTFSGIFLTKMGCPPGSLDRRFLRGLESARTYRIEGNTLLIEVAGDGGTMRFFRVHRQN